MRTIVGEFLPNNAPSPFLKPIWTLASVGGGKWELQAPSLESENINKSGKIVQEKNECNILQFFTTPQKCNCLNGKKIRNNTQKAFHFCQTYIRLCVSPLLASCGYFWFGYTILVFWKCKKNGNDWSESWRIYGILLEFSLKDFLYVLSQFTIIDAPSAYF